MITGELRTKHQKNGNTHHYTYYHCTHKSKTVKCSEQAIREPDLVSQLSSLIKQTALPPDWADFMKTKLDEDKKDSAQSVSAFVSETTEHIRAINDKLQRLLDGYLDQLIDQEVYKVEKNKLVGQKQSLEEKLARITQTQTGWIEPMSAWLDKASALSKIAECSGLDEIKSASE